MVDRRGKDYRNGKKRSFSNITTSLVTKWFRNLSTRHYNLLLVIIYHNSWKKKRRRWNSKRKRENFSVAFIVLCTTEVYFIIVIPITCEPNLITNTDRVPVNHRCGSLSSFQGSFFLNLTRKLPTTFIR